MTATRTASDLVAGLKTKVTTTLDRVIPPGPIALVDFPNHSNVGDSAIWLGETAYLRAAGRLPAYVCALGDFADDDLKAAAPEGPILIHGGGNFGTLWPRHEAFRLHLLRTYRDRPIVQLPQSIHYADEASSAEMAQAIAAHGRFTLLLRDARSLAFADAHFDCETALCPDSALVLGPLRRPRRPDARILALLRTDHERGEGVDEGAMPDDVLALDWLDETSRSRWAMRQRLKLARFAPTPEGRRLGRYEALAWWRVRRGLRILSRGEAVVTDRLHAHILSLLLDLPHVVLDNSYGKVSGFVEQWTKDYKALRSTGARAQAFAIARDLLAAGHRG